MKAMILTLSPEECAKLLNGDLSVLVRKKFPKDYVGWVYIYCTKGNLYLFLNNLDKKYYCVNKSLQAIKDSAINGKVVARFWCDKVKSIWKTTTNIWTYGSDLEPNFYKESCLNDIELDRYFKPTKVGFGKVYGYAIHITNLEIFDKPKEISEFHKIDNSNGFICFKCPHLCTDDSAGYSIDSCDLGFENCEKTRLTRAPHPWCYVEV